MDTITIPRPDVGDHRDECSFALQDCPEGQKCIAVAAAPETTWSEFRCVPVVEDPDAPGEPCMGMFFGADTWTEAPPSPTTTAAMTAPRDRG